MEVKVTINCCFCSEQHSQTMELPEGWAHRYEGIDDESSGFCPKHSRVADFAAAQCPGCVGGWGDCSMWQSFAYQSQRDITEQDLAILRTGRCPKRTNGSFGFSRESGIKDIDLSSQEALGGKAFAEAIEEYCERYPARTYP